MNKNKLKKFICLCCAICLICGFTVNAKEVILFQGGTYSELSGTAETASASFSVIYSFDYSLIKNIKYHIKIYIPNYNTTNSANKIVIRYYYLIYAEAFRIIIENNNITSYQKVDNVKFINRILEFDIIPTVNINSGVYKLALSYYSIDNGQNFIIDTPISPIITISNIIDNTKDFINNVNNTSSELLKSALSVFSFFLKPTVLPYAIVGTAVGLVSFGIVAFKKFT